MPSFTLQISNLKTVGPVVEIKIAVGNFLEEILSRSRVKIPDPVNGLAMIDTGATVTVVREDLIKKLGLNPVGMVKINTSYSTNVPCYEYLIRVLFPNNVIIETRAIGAPLLGQHIQFLIGRDILQNSVFIYNGQMNSFTINF